MNSYKKLHFEISERKVLLKIVDIFVVLLFLHGISVFLNFDYFSIFSSSNYLRIFVLAVYFLLFASVFEMYNLQVASNSFQTIRSIILTTSVTVLAYLLTPILTPELPSNRLQIIVFYAAIFLGLLLWRTFYIQFFASHRFSKKAILICDEDQVIELMQNIEKADMHYKIVGFVSSENQCNIKIKSKKVSCIQFAEIETFVKANNVSEIVVASQKVESITAELYNQLIHLLENGYTIREYTQLYENLTQRIPVQYVSRDFYRYFPFSRSNNNKLYLLISRMVDIVISMIGLSIGVLFLPLLIVGNLIGNRGKILYSQERIGKNGVAFTIYKYRTMVIDAEKNGAVFAQNNDSRVTTFGKFLRKTRIDEFPQFLNVLKGDMALIGPRPERPIFVNKIAQVMPFYETRHIVKPGLTGWAQVNYPYGNSIEDSLVKLQYDLYYIKHRSLFLDVNIVLKTLSTVLFFRGQ